MLVIFKSKAAAEVIMYEEHAKRILDLLGKDTKRGVITAAEAGDAIAKVEAEIARIKTAEEEKAREEASAEGSASDDDKETRPKQGVSFATRSYPLLEMLRAAQRQGQPVAWGI
jgi:predicted metalloendopeptidase